MKVIGKGSGYGDDYLCMVSHAELEKVVGKYYGSEPPLKTLAIGAEMNLGDGYDYRESIKSACSSMVNATKQFESSQKTLLEFALMVAKRDTAGEVK